VILAALLARRSASGLLGVPGLLRGLGFGEALLVSIEQSGFLALFVWVRTAGFGAITRLSVRWFRSHEFLVSNGESVDSSRTMPRRGSFGALGDLDLTVIPLVNHR